VTPWLDDGDVRLYHGDNLDVLRALPDRSVHMCATSPPFYGLRSYIADGHDDKPLEIGLEDTPDLWVERLVAVFREVRRVLRDDGTLWVEIGDSYNSGASGGLGGSTLGGGQDNQAHSNRSGRGYVTGHKHKDLIGQPWLLAFALRADGWYLRSEIIWARPNPMPESVTDRPTKSHSTVFLLSKQPRYFYDADAIRERLATDSPGVQRSLTRRKDGDGTGDGRHTRFSRYNAATETPEAGANSRSVWFIPTQPTPFAHFATWPEALCRRMILAGTSERGCCPECGAPWTRDTERELGERTGGSGGAGKADAARPHGTQTYYDAWVARKLNVTTVGWSPSCACFDFEEQDGTRNPYPPVPCTVLDPFAGSATTMLVARNHGRHSIGIGSNS
jgi:DNA modification methylase